MTDQIFLQNAPAGPGVSPTWCSSAKEMVGCALGSSCVWFTIGGGIVNEVFYPRIDIPQIRDLGFIVADDQNFWVEVKRLDSHRLIWAAPGVPAIEILHEHPRFTLRLRIVPDPRRDVLLVDIQLEGEPGLRPYALLAPHNFSPGELAKRWQYIPKSPWHIAHLSNRNFPRCADNQRHSDTAFI